MHEYVIRVIPADLIGVGSLELLTKRPFGDTANRAISDISDLVLQFEFAGIELVIPRVSVDLGGDVGDIVVFLVFLGVLGGLGVGDGAVGLDLAPHLTNI